MRAQVVIIGAGPAGLLLSHLLQRAGIMTLILERQSREHVLARIRAGVLEWGSTQILREAGLGTRMDSQGAVHEGCALAISDSICRVDFLKACGRPVTIYGQTEITRDLFAAQDAAGTPLVENAEDVTLEGLAGAAPVVRWRRDGRIHETRCEFIVGCDGFHGISRRSIPEGERTEFERTYPFGWLGLLSRTPPVHHELIYAGHARGFALASMRGPQLSRYYLQVDAGETVDRWSDQAFWDELKRRLPPPIAERLVTGPSIEKSIAPLRSFVCEPMRWGRLFLCGDAAHIVPPTGAKGLNLAISDVHYLATALRAYYAGDGTQGLDEYSARALSRVWKALRFSWWMTGLLHQFPAEDGFTRRIRESERRHLTESAAAQAAFAESYTGPPL